ncbi:MAG: metal ABC transporter permease [Gammaproteobacteria bacterium]|nr:iron chelate uptake ABC transporter family permease subunit [Gammaproteobacteria bacterium]NIO61703.1 iron chelate uptake ABC transporter family permease subunit [Gammaproteobacteria bacterium]NIP49323.1 metal ABC transporter permease [Gammaproteobacteria bacterium]NIQ10545.1 metal ABC transporter permease [Gammaproteobacteria bacterium]NIQ18954.1 iron chelate uptake ABC transporter family permease subunit [Gammaproteobacteria bacterium]
MSEFFSYNFIQHAMLACILASIGCGIMGTYVVVRRIGFLAGGIAHSVLAGMGIAYYLGNTPLVGAVIAALVASVLIGLINLKWRQNEDILIAMFWSVGMAIGILFISRTPGYNVDLMSYLFGNILLVSGNDLVLMLLLDILLFLLATMLYRQFLVTAFDQEFARLRGINVEFYYILLLSMVALTVVLLIQVVGLILVLALLILPAASATQFVSSIKPMMLLSVLFSLFVTTSGLVISYQPDLPSGATIIIIASFVYLVSIISKRIQVKLTGNHDN